MRWTARVALLLVMLPGSVIAANARPHPSHSITQQELVDRAQALMDAVPPGDKRPWQKYYADDCLFFDEKGRKMTKAQLMAEIEPMPAGYGGSIRIVRPESRLIGDTAVLSYDMDESETIFGQKLSARYHATDTWMYRKGQWQIIATQVLRYYEDPAVGVIDTKDLASYAGTYELAPGHRLVVSMEGNDLYAQRDAKPRELMLPETTGIFFRKGVEGRRLFHYGNDGRVDMLIDRRNNEDILWKRVE